jgi:hypothetical protein
MNLRNGLDQGYGSGMARRTALSSGHANAQVLCDAISVEVIAKSVGGSTQPSDAGDIVISPKAVSGPRGVLVRVGDLFMSLRLWLRSPDKVFSQ